MKKNFYISIVTLGLVSSALHAGGDRVHVGVLPYVVATQPSEDFQFGTTNYLGTLYRGKISFFTSSHQSISKNDTKDLEDRAKEILKSEVYQGKRITGGPYQIIQNSRRITTFVDGHEYVVFVGEISEKNFNELPPESQTAFTLSDFQAHQEQFNPGLIAVLKQLPEEISEEKPVREPSELETMIMDEPAAMARRIPQYQKEKEEEVNAYDERGFTPLARAVLSGDSSAVQSLLYMGADPNLYVGSDADTALTLAIKKIKPGDPKYLMLQTLIQGGANVDQPDGSDNATPLMWAIEKSDFGAIKTLFALVPNLNITHESSDGSTALKQSILLDPKYPVNQAIIQMIIQHVFAKTGTVDTVDRFSGNTPLMLAIYQNNHFAIEQLLKAGARLDIQNQQGQTPYSVSRRGDQKTQQIVDNAALQQQQQALLQQRQQQMIPRKMYPHLYS